MVKWAVLAVLLLPLAEIGVFALVAAWLGLGWAVGLTLATSAAGFLVLRAAGRGGLDRLRTAGADAEPGALRAMTGALLTVVGGVLLLLPGFITDLTGALLLLAPVRRWCGAALRTAAGPASARTDGVVDLEQDEWSRVPDPGLEDRRERRPGPGRTD